VTNRTIRRGHPGNPEDRVLPLSEGIAEIARAVLSGRGLESSEVFALAERGSRRPHELLYWAHRVRTARFGSAVKLCSIAPRKLGGCSEDCKWCAQSVVSARGVISPRRTVREEVLGASRQAARQGASSFGIVNSGRRPARGDIADVIELSRRIAEEVPARIEVCASMGELTDGQAHQLAAAGVTRYNHNLETSRRFYPTVVTTHSYDDRLRTLNAARKVGMRLCCGGIFGIGESWGDRVDLALTLRDEVRPQVVPLNFLHPIPGTPLGDAIPLKPLEILTIIAVFRLVLPDVDLKVAGGREANLRDMQSWIFYAGATSCLIGNYLTTPGRPPEEDLRMIADLGLTVVKKFPVQTPAPIL
jgi:biotin synthase